VQGLWENPFRVAAVYVATNALIMLVLGMLVVRARVATRTEIGDGGSPAMQGPLRAHGNNTENVPLPLLMMLFICSLGGPVLLIHAVGAPLTLGRIAHAVGLTQSVGVSIPRFIGMTLTWIAFIVGVAACLWLALMPPATSGIE